MKTVDIPDGRISGSVNLTRQAEVQAYLGIPFAAPPTGINRFRPPAPVLAWTGVLDAKHTGPAAPQNPDPVMAAGGFWQPPYDEGRCLNLNVWTPAADDRRRPVMVWIHGGAYITGSNSSGFNSGAELAAALDVVVVSANYRLGALGFLALDHLLGEEYQDSGSLGVLDQIAALRWVRDNIVAFGGDPDIVTVFGQSAGGAMVGTLLGSPQASGLFRRVIAQSGTAERARPADESHAVTAEFLNAADLQESDAEKLLTMDVDEILAVQAKVVESHTRATIGLALPFQPTLGTSVLPVLPLDAIRNGVNADVDLLAGTNLNEASFFTTLRPVQDGIDGATKARRIVETDVGVDAYPHYVTALGRELGREPTDDELFESALSDRLYRQPTSRMLEARLNGATGRTFSYLFTWPSPLMNGKLGACHALEVPFVFRVLHRLEASTLVGENPPKELSEWVSGAWVEFARRGTPQSPGLPDWSAYAEPNRFTMLLNRRPELRSDPRGELRRMWNAPPSAPDTHSPVD